MLLLLICQIFCFWSKFVSFTLLSRQLVIALSLFSIYGKISSCKKYKKSIESDRWTDEQINRTGFIGPIPKSWRFSALSRFNIHGKTSSCKKLRKPTEQILRKMCHRWSERQTNRCNRIDFIGPLPQRSRFDHPF